MNSYNNTIDVVFSTDEKYVQHFCVALTSLLEHNCSIINNIYLLHDINSTELLDEVFHFVSRKYNKKIIVLFVRDSIFDHLNVTDHISKASYYRLLLPKLLPAAVDRVLYLDSDLVVTSKLDSLIKLNFELCSRISTKEETVKRIETDEFFLFAVSELKWQSKSRLIGIGLTGYKYFNAGVLLINLKKWRLENVSENLLSIASELKERLKFHDQDVLNIAFENSWGKLNPKYNLLNVWIKNDLLGKQFCIIHYTGNSKPWEFSNSHPLKIAYWRYLWKTPFKYYVPPDLNLKNLLYKLLKLSFSLVKEMLRMYSSRTRLNYRRS